MGFPNGSTGKESAYNAGDTGQVGSIPGWGRYPGGRKGNPLQYSCLKYLMDRGPGSYSPKGQKELDMTEHTSYNDFFSTVIKSPLLRRLWTDTNYSPDNIPCLGSLPVFSLL